MIAVVTRSQPWDGNDMDHYADDLAQLIETLTWHIAMFGFRPAVARSPVGRHRAHREAALISAVPP